MKLKAKFAPRRDGSYGRVGEVVIEADGTVEIADQTEAQRLIKVGTFEAYHFATVVDAIPKEAEPEPIKMIVSNGDETYDLMAMNKEHLLWLAREEMELDVDGRASEQKLREIIFAHANTD